MYLTTVKAKGITYVRLVEARWDKEKIRSFPKVLKQFGRLDVLTKDNPNALEELRRKYCESEETTGEYEADDEKELDNYQNLNFSAYPIAKIFNELELGSVIGGIKDRNNIEFDVGRTILHLLCSRIVDAQSHHYNWCKQGQWMGTRTNPLELHHFYRSLDFLENNRDELMKWINDRLTEKGRDLTLVFFDCTNTYFETPWDDNKCECIRTARQCGMTSLEVMREGIVDPEPLRMRGLPKEKRNDMPQIGVALVIDREGIPFDFRVYAGDKSEKTEMVESIKRLKGIYGIKKCIVVADRGLNTLVNLINIEQEGLGCMVAQS